MNADRASRGLLVAAILCALLSPVGLPGGPAVWFGIGILLAGSAWAMRAFVHPTASATDGAEFEPRWYEMARAEKNRLFRHSAESPIPAAERLQFVALRYFPPTEAARVVATFQETADKVAVELGASNGEVSTYLRWGVLEGSFQGVPLALAAFRHEGDPEGALFVPFRDGTSGTESYGGGRYLEVAEDGDGYVLDFNRAYNPYCAYSPEWVCPLPPEENVLPFAMPAGERAYLPPDGTAGQASG